MRIAEEVTFGGSGYDRAAQLRPEAESLWQRPDARAMILWRGKPLVTDAEVRALFFVEVGHPVMDLAGEPIFLGLPDGVPTFAVDLSGWNPSEIELHSGFLDPTEQSHPLIGEGAVFAELRAVMTHLSPQDAELASTARAVLGWHDSHKFCSKCGHESKMAVGGWQRNCPSCGAPHFPRTDPVAIMLVTHGNSVLLGRSPAWPERMYSCLAGFVEPGETIEAAVRREVFEEAGIRCARVTYLASQPWAFPMNLMFGCHAEASSTEITVDPAELEDARWVTKEELALAFAGEHPDISPARKGSIAHFMLFNWLADRLD
ncbi:NAD(+) diphosphatase [Marivivens sp. LCG002]|uniref:NAD(+) diphosphatase n=1 Tax=Marivivens sp. LCG002 TaxID=3051171 RepID=UPI002554CB04|nr:NAD(+) diphosphatase [Marivivens sp. LCG002]WIV50508.1 NAD(+) diphosphatase [Marivivens sp. LCG002]